MKALPSGAWSEQQVANLEAWRNCLCRKLSQELSRETTVEILTYQDQQENRLRRFVNTYVGLTRTAKVEINYPEPITSIITRVLEAHDEHPNQSSEGTGRPQEAED